jgi:hypothetical protein
MMSDPRVLRPLDPSERYFWLLDHLAPMNIVAVAELEVRLDPAQLATALHAVQLRHPLLRVQIGVFESQPTFVNVAAEIPLTTTPVADGGWRDVVEAELDLPFVTASEPLVRCVYVPVEGEDRSVVILAVHHAVADGRGIVRALQDLLQAVENGEPDPALSADVPPLIHDHFPAELQSSRAAVSILGTVRSERQGYPESATYPFHARDVEGQISRLSHLVLTPELAAAIRVGARAHGATVTGELAAAVLESCTALFDQPEDRMLCLATPTDLRERVMPALPGDGVYCAVGLLCTPYLVHPSSNPDLSLRVSEQTHREVTRGESHLFYRLARANAFAANDHGIDTFADWMATTPQNVGLSNIGVVDDTDDPVWVSSISVSLSTSSNQVAFVVVSTYRGRLVMNVVTDRAKLPDDLAERLVEGIEARTGASGPSGERTSEARRASSGASHRRLIGEVLVEG